MAVTPEGVLRVLDRRGRPLFSPKMLARELGGGRPQQRALATVLRGLVAKGQVEHLRGSYRIARSDVLREGTLVEPAPGVPGADDVLQVIEDDGSLWRIAGGRAGAEPGERVLIDVCPGASGGPTAEIVRAVGSVRREWVGIVERDGGAAQVRPYRGGEGDTWALPVSRADLGGARTGDVVVAQPTPAGRRSRGRRREERVRVSEVLGPPGTPEADFRAIAWKHRLPIAFPEAVARAADACASGVSRDELGRRADLRDRDFVTIDPETARDHDDAVCVEPGPGDGCRLWVAIADVSHYVREGTALDAEALRRGNSVYLPDRAVPMLPERLSSDLCSLLPEVDRLALVAELEVGPRGAVRRSHFHRAVIRSRRRLVYEDAATVMDGGSSAAVPEQSLEEQLRRLGALAGRLTRRRLRAGALDFDLPEARIVLDDAGKPVDVVRAARTTAHRAIEEAMLLANRAVAERLEAAEQPAIYRIHEAPLPARLEALQELLDRFGLLEGERLGEVLDPRILVRALERARGLPQEGLINLVTLRSMRQARYAETCVGHFALAFDAYCHFTSPIRRYADLVVHRALGDLLDRSAASRTRAAARASRVAGWAARISWTERAAISAEREATDLKKCVLMLEHVGESYGGTITGVARHGLYVTLDPLFLEGLVHVRRLPGFYEVDDLGLALVARSGHRFSLGDRLRVRVAQVDVVRGWIDLEPLDLPESSPRPRRGSGKRDERSREKGKPRPARKGARPSKPGGRKGATSRRPKRGGRKRRP